jgi:hypothetical protein
MNPFDFSWMVGRHVGISYSKPSTWSFVFGDSLNIRVECPWRLLVHGGIAISSDDDQQQFGLPAPINVAEHASSLIVGTAVQRVEIRKGTADLLIDFDSNRRLEIIPFSSGYESWQVSTLSGKMIVAQGGGQLSVWQP